MKNYIQLKPRCALGRFAPSGQLTAYMRLARCTSLAQIALLENEGLEWYN